MMGYGVSGGLGWMWIMGLFGLLVLAGVVVLVIWAVRTLWPDRRSTLASDDPLAQLKLRLARGEITQEDYETLRAHLRD